MARPGRSVAMFARPRSRTSRRLPPWCRAGSSLMWSPASAASTSFLGKWTGSPKPGYGLPMLSEKLKNRFDQVIARYPLKRSAIVPLLLFAQDEIGYVSDEAIEEIAR